MLSFMKDKLINSIEGFSWDEIYFMLKEPKFYSGLLTLLRKQGIFEPVVWSYSLFYKNDVGPNRRVPELALGFQGRLRALLQLAADYRSGRATQGLDIWIITRWSVREFTTVVTPENESGSVGERPLILNQNFYNQYISFIHYLIEKNTWELVDKMNLAYYLILQERTKVAIDVFKKIQAKEVAAEGTLRLQYDYMRAYLDFYTGYPEFKVARGVSAQYRNYPVPNWRLYFDGLAEQLDEYDGKIDPHKAEEEAKIIGSERLEPQLSILLNGKEVLIEYNKIEEITVKYYVIDLEVLFSRTPFLTNAIDDFSFVQPQPGLPPSSGL